MGSSQGSIDPQIIYEYMKLKDQQKKLQLEKKTDYKQMIDHSWQIFLTRLPTYKYQDAFPKRGKKHITFVGGISSGKSALINKLFNTKLKTAKRQCTGKDVCGNNDLVVWDTRGFNQQFNLQTQVAAIRYVKTFDHIFICCNTSVRSLVKEIQVLTVLNVPFSFVRTHCDRDQEQEEQRSIEQELQTDRANLSKINSNNQVRIFATSKKGGFDNDKLKNFIISNFGCGNSNFTIYPLDKKINY